MSTISKENEILSSTLETSSARPAARTDEPAVRQQPVALEVPVSVNGARTVNGSDKREPFSESTKTVLIFGNGAVIRLSSAVAPGQLLFLTNEKTRKEVVCQVVKSKNYRNVSGYVELEFTESVVGFWGMRFPGDRIGSAPPVASGAQAPSGLPSASPKPVAPPAPKSEPVLAVNSPKISELRPASVPVIAPPHAAVLPIKPVEPIQAAAIKPAFPVTSQVAPPIVPAAIDLTPLPVAPEVKVFATLEVQAPPAHPAEDSTEALKRKTARLQEDLSNLLFADNSAAKNTPVPAAISPMDATLCTESTAKILAFANAEPAAPAILPAPLAIDHAKAAMENVKPAVMAPSPVKSLLDFDEDVKIPAWLEPLARNTVAPVSTQELIEREKAKHAAALPTKPEIEELAADPLPAPVSEAPLNLQVPTFGSDLPLDEPQFMSEISSKSSKAPLWLGLIAAALILAVGGTWYFKQQSNTVLATAPVASAAAPSVASNGLASQPEGLPATKSPALVPVSSAQMNSPSNATSSPVSRNQAVTSSAAGAATSLVNTNARVNVARSAETVEPEPQPQPKKPVLGQVRLAAPTAKRGGASQNAGEPELSIEGSKEYSSNADALGSGILAGNSKQPSAPSAPLPVGGDVKTAKLISAVPPVYSSLAKAQHVSGDVKIDALIDATGRVTSMKVVSGPTLLHQSAMDSLRQWKYQPAALDGKAVPMHLTVTIQFRLQ